MSEVRFGILGSGNMARVYAVALQTQVEGGRFVATALGSGTTKLAEEFRAVAEPDAAALLARDDLDAVVIATPHSTHRALAVEAAAAGKHVYIEKPMALNVAECDEIIEACASSSVTLTIAKQTRHMEMATRAKALLDAGEIGDLRYVRAVSAIAGWTNGPAHWSDNPAEGDAFLDWGAHGCDALRWFSGSEAVRISAEYENFGPIVSAPFPTAAVQIRMANGVIAQFLLSYEVPNPGIGTNSNNQYFLMGSEGMIEFDLDRVRLGKGDRWETVWELPTWINPLQPDNPRRIGNTARQVQDFIDAVREGREPAITGGDGRAAIAMTEAASRSARTGETITLGKATTRATDS